MTNTRSYALAGLALLVLTACSGERPGGPVPTTTLIVPKIAQKSEIVIDRWGIPHIYANSVQDLFFTQGFNAARDRLWQLDLWRRQGEGRLAEAFGPRFVERDRAARLFLYRGDLAQEFASYAPSAREILTAFTDGLNAYIAMTRGNPDLLPLEFKLTGTAPGDWTPTTPLVRIFGLTRNVTSEVRFAGLVRSMGAEAVEKLSGFQPPARLEVPPGLDLALVDDAVLKDYFLARAGIRFRAEDVLAPLGHAERERIAQLISLPSADPGGNAESLPFESNNWTISGRLTATGRPILAGDPHRAQLVPSLRYIAHLVGPGWNVIGAGEPALPGVSLGHNESVAWALTIFSFADEEDLYVYDTNPGNPSEYRYGGRWEAMRSVEESIPVRGGSPVPVTLEFTRHGPVLFKDPVHRKAYALRAAYLEHPGTGAYLASLGLDRARNGAEFVHLAERHFMPSLNFVYADVTGHIGWLGGSLAPIRRNWNGLLPVPGDGRYEWDGFVEASQLPRLEDPAAGFFATANEFNIPPGYPYAAISSREWADPYRFQRIDEVLREGRAHTTRDSMRLQYDELSVQARELVSLLKPLEAADPDVASALAALRGWDCVVGRGSVPATIFEFWLSRLRTKVFDLCVPAAARLEFGPGDGSVLTELLNGPDAAFGPDPRYGRDALLLKSLAEAVATLNAKLGPDRSRWTWGALHHVQYDSALGPAVAPEMRELLNIGSLPIGGDGQTVHATAYRADDFSQTHGATYRQVLDLSNWDLSFALNSPGQSGDPYSPHYRDLFPLAAEGQYVPLLFSRKKIMAAAERVIELRPQASSAPARGGGKNR